MNNRPSELQFRIDFISPNGDERNLLSRNMTYPYQNSPEHIKSGYPSKYDDNLVEYSIEAINLSNHINYLIRDILKDASMDYMEKYQHSMEYSPSPDTTDCYYLISLIDTTYPKYLPTGEIMKKIIVKKGDKKIAEGHNNDTLEGYINIADYDKKHTIEMYDDTRNQTIFTSRIDARDYVYNPNFIPPFGKVWKDYHHISDPNPNSELSENGVSKRTMNPGIRSTIKELLDYREYTNRFKNRFETQNLFSAFSIQ